MPDRLIYGQVQRSAMNWPIFVAEQLGFFREQGLTAEARIYTSPLEPVTALISGSLDLLNVIPDVALREIVKGAPLAVVANTNSRAQYRLMAHPEIRDYADLKGKRIGVNDGRSAEGLILKRLLRLKGLKADSYELAATGAPQERCKRLREGAVAATMVTQPFNFLLEDEGFANLATSAEVVPDYPFTVCVVRREETFNEAVLSFLRTVSRSWRWLSDHRNRERAIPTMTQWTGASEKPAQATYDLYLNSPEPPSLAPTEEGVATVLELLAESGAISLPLPPATKFIDGRYFEKLTEVA
jgi:ABC-type nitrate/sulfonate/bicarbonate transport system substrate-binding protein